LAITAIHAEIADDRPAGVVAIKDSSTRVAGSSGYSVLDLASHACGRVTCEHLPSRFYLHLLNRIARELIMASRSSRIKTPSFFDGV